MTIADHPRCVVTGGASGLGRALCVALGKRGGRVLVADLNLDEAAVTAEQVRAAGGKAEVTPCDVSKLDDVAGLLDRMDALFGGVDLVANNAGVAGAGPVGEVSLEDWQWIVNVNLWGVIYGCHVFAPRLKAQGSGHILNVASAAGLMSPPEFAPYNVTKAGVVALSQTIALELAPHGVGVTVVCPTFFRTNIIKGGRFERGQPEVTKAALQMMEKAKTQASDVARYALASCDRDDLYSVPMADGRWGWRVKRLDPDRFYKKVLPWIMQVMRAEGTKGA